MAPVLSGVIKAASCDKNVLVLGETGTGKDTVARRIHELSPRRDEPFVAINCANLPEGLFESELFGHARGAFTGAVREKSGLLDVAERGTVFYDEIGELALPLQARMLRLLDKRESRRLGGVRTRIVRARFIFATNRDLLWDVREGRFRKDLYYRINVIRIRIPPLAVRREDIPELVRFFVDRENGQAGLAKSISGAAMAKLMRYGFPGNVRELENIVTRAMVLSEGEEIGTDDIAFDPEDPYEGRDEREMGGGHEGSKALARKTPDFETDGKGGGSLGRAGQVAVRSVGSGVGGDPAGRRRLPSMNGMGTENGSDHDPNEQHSEGGVANPESRDDDGPKAGEDAISRRELIEALELCHWNKTKAARELGRSRRQLYRLLERHGLGRRLIERLRGMLTLA